MGKYHQVRQGECFSSLAKKYGFVDYQTISGHAENAELMKTRANPNVLYPDDRVFIPDNELKEVDAVTETKHVFELKRAKTLFRLIVEDADEKPYADVRYELKIDQRIYEGTTDARGKLEQEIPASARAGELFLFADEEDETRATERIELVFGNLDPVEELTGVQSRLNNLGFGCGRVDGALGEKTRRAIREFQEKHELTATGEPCAATREKLRRIHDWQNA